MGFHDFSVKVSKFLDCKLIRELRRKLKFFHIILKSAIIPLIWCIILPKNHPRPKSVAQTLLRISKPQDTMVLKVCIQQFSLFSGYLLSVLSINVTKIFSKKKTKGPSLLKYSNMCRAHQLNTHPVSVSQLGVLKSPKKCQFFKTFPGWILRISFPPRRR